MSSQYAHNPLSDEVRRAHLAVYFHNIFFVNDVACGAVVQALSDIRKSAYCRHRVKMLVSALDVEQKRYERDIRVRIAKHAEPYAEMCDTFVASIESDVDVFYYTIKNHLDSHGVRDAAVIARAVWMCELVRQAVTIYDSNIATVVKTLLPPPVVGVPAHLRLGKMLYLAELICKEKPFDWDDGTDSAMCNQALQAIHYKFTDARLIQAAMESV